MVLFTVWFICLLVVGTYVCKFVCQFVGWGLGLLLCLLVCWLGGYVWYWVCLFVGWWLCDNVISFNSRDGVSVGLFYYRFKAIPWILNYKWADCWPYWEFIYLFFSMWPSVVMCITMGYLFHVWGGVAFFFFFFFFVLFCDKYLY